MLRAARLRRRTPAEAEAARRTAGTSTFWILAVGAALFTFMGWLLPWFVSPFSSGVGFSPMDVIVGGITGVGSILVYLLAITMLAVVVAPLYETVQRRRGRPRSPRADRAIAAASLVGLLLTVAIFLLVRILAEEPLFGPLRPNTITDSAVWLTMVGYIFAGVAYGLRGWVVRAPSTAFAVVALPFGLLLPLMFHQAPDFIFWAASSLAIYTLLALGLNVVVGFAGLLDLGYAAFFAIGAYTCASLSSPKYGVHVPLFMLIFIGAAVAAVFGALLGAPTLRLRGDYLAIVTLGFGEIIPSLAANNTLNLTNGPNGISSIDKPHFGFVDFSVSPAWYYLSLLVLIVIVVILLRNLERSRLGRAWVAIREDEVAAAATGINTTSTKLLAFAIGASVSGLAGAFYGSIVGVVSPDDFNISVSVSVLSIVVLGGIGNVVGVLLGAGVLSFVIFWVLQNMNGWLGTLSTTTGVTQLANIDVSHFTYIIYGLALVLMMLLRPGGLIPSRARQVELTQAGEESLAAIQGTA